MARSPGTICRLAVTRPVRYLVAYENSIDVFFAADLPMKA
jgi:hypothetical protein